MMVGGNPSWWNNMDNIKPPHQEISPLLPCSTSSAGAVASSTFVVVIIDNQGLPDPWSQMLLGGVMEEEEKCGFGLQTKKVENWEDHQLYPSGNSHVFGAKQENLERSAYLSSSTKSCVTTNSLSTNMLDFSHSKEGKRHFNQNNHLRTGSAFKKARVQASSAQSPLIKKEKLGDRISALHQLVSPFGKTDTASVLLEAIGYIRFLQALSLPYLDSGQGTPGIV
uniref:BHLH domain-containing protein n=1 Tax=Ananas comosus var. bracteatus TaxID=296719 RepID=A0A6V7PV12_ANACO|nr:unnamed protein product [Ananas comosus var. bracteatus]